MATTVTAPALSDEELVELLALIKGADSVELKLTVPESDRTPAGAALGVDPLDAQIRQVFFFDTPDLALNKRGRRRPRPAGAAEGRRLGRQAAAGRPDRAAGGAAPLAELRRRGRRDARRVRLLGIDEARARTTATSRTPWRASEPLRKLFSKEQRALLRRARARGARARRPRDPRPDLRAQAEVRAQGLRAQARRRAVALPGRLA